MEALQQEVFSLKMRLEAKAKMEADYLEEIEQLKREQSELQKELKATRQAQPVCQDQASVSLWGPNPELHDELTSEMEDLRSKLKAVELENCGLRERLDILEMTKDTTSVNVSYDPVLAETNLELEHLREQLQVYQSEKARMERLLAEKDADIESAQGHASELQMALNAAREELADTVAELECLKVQSNPTSNSRGNSIFGELEDRRVRAEKLVVKQKAKIDQLRQDLTSVRSEFRQRMLQFIQETEDKFNKRDTQIIEDLKAERDRLSLEVDRLEATVKVLKDEKLDALREADKFAEAFRPGKNNGKRLIAALENCLMDASQRVSEAEEKTEALRRQLLTSSNARYELSRELLQQTALLKRLTTEMQAMKESPSNVGGKENIDPLSPPVEADDPSKVPSPPSAAATVQGAQTSGPVFLWEVDPTKNPGVATVDDERRHQDKGKTAEELGCKPS
ncbi:hypothetical protein AAHC03_01456 [Spirometra sp. Aus1]